MEFFFCRGAAASKKQAQAGRCQPHPQKPNRTSCKLTTTQRGVLNKRHTGSWLQAAVASRQRAAKAGAPDCQQKPPHVSWPLRNAFHSSTHATPVDVSAPKACRGVDRSSTNSPKPAGAAGILGGPASSEIIFPLICSLQCSKVLRVLMGQQPRQRLGALRRRGVHSSFLLRLFGEQGCRPESLCACMGI